MCWNPRSCKHAAEWTCRRSFHRHRVPRVRCSACSPSGVWSSLRLMFLMGVLCFGHPGSSQTQPQSRKSYSLKFFLLFQGLNCRDSYHGSLDSRVPREHRTGPTSAALGPDPFSLTGAQRTQRTGPVRTLNRAVPSGEAPSSVRPLRTRSDARDAPSSFFSGS